MPVLIQIFIRVGLFVAAIWAGANGVSSMAPKNVRQSKWLSGKEKEEKK